MPNRVKPEEVVNGLGRLRTFLFLIEYVIVYLCSSACNCYTLGTASGNDTMCDQVTGQCMCNATANIGGRRCDKCMENSWNSSAGVCQGKPICFYSQECQNSRIKINPKSYFWKILKNKWYHAKVLMKRIYLNGHTIGFRR